MDRSFALPDAPIATLLIDQTTANSKVLPSETVLCINRGRTTLTDTFDAVHLEIPPGLFHVRYDAAQHIQRRLIVPGTRNLEVGGYQSFIGILGSADGRIKLDADEFCRPFTDEELRGFGERLEAVDRTALSNPADRAVVPISTAAARAASLTQGVGGATHRPQIDTGTQASDLAREAADHVFDPPETSDTAEAEAEAGVEVPEKPRRRR